MNVAARLEKKNEETGKREAGEKRKQATDFKEAACCLLRSFWRQHGEKFEKANSHFDQPKRDEDRTNTLRAAADWCRFNSLAKPY